MILSSETSSGKSTQVPQLLVYDEYESGLQIACTQPRRLVATELASRVAEEMGVVLGEEVGYKINDNHMVNQNKKRTRLAYMTENVLLRQLRSDKFLSAYACVIIDEAHERTVNLDLLLALLKKVVSRRKDFRVGPYQPFNLTGGLTWLTLVIGGYHVGHDGCKAVPRVF